MDEQERRAIVVHPPHRWRGVRADRSGRWPVLTLGWMTVELVSIGRRLVHMLDVLRRR